MKIAVVGAGGFRTPLIHGALLEGAAELGITEVSLYDTDAGRLALMMRVLAGLSAERRSDLPVKPAPDITSVVRGARFVLVAVRAGGLAARVVDETVPLELGVLGQETVGPGGIAFALRTLPVMREIAEAVDRHAPEATLINFTNPAGLITEALQAVLGERAIGICDSPAHLCRDVAAALEIPPPRLAFEYAGLNHLGWLLGVRAGGRDLLGPLLADDRAAGRLEAARLLGTERLRELGVVPNEYLVYYERPDRVVAALTAGETRGQLLQRTQPAFYSGEPGDNAGALRRWRIAANQRNRTYMAEAREGGDDGDGREDDRPPAGGYEHEALALMLGLHGVRPGVQILDVANQGALRGLDDTAVVEVPCSVGQAGARPLAAPPLPPTAATLVETVKRVERLTIEASRRRSRALAVEAIALHPLVARTDLAELIMERYLARLPAMRALLD